MESVEQLKAQRDAAENRFIKAREEASELEQQVADLQNELMRTKLMHNEQLLTERRQAHDKLNQIHWGWFAAGAAVAWVVCETIRSFLP